MKNLVRGGIILSILSLFVVFIYAQTQTEKGPVIANDSQLQLNKKETTDDQKTDKTQDKNKDNKDQDNKQTKVNTKADQKSVTEEKEEDKEEQQTKAGEEKPSVKHTASSRAVRGASRGRFIATAYCLRGRTASGANVRRGIIAADPRVLRLGTRVSLAAGAYSGDYVVADTGGKIKGNRVDIWMASCAEARRFGRRTVTVYTR